MGGAIAGGRAYPTPGVEGSGLGTNAVQAAQAPALQPNLRPMQPLPSAQSAQALRPLTPSMGASLQPGQAAFPTGQSPTNPWGINRGGSGSIPVSRRPGTLPASRIAL